MRRSRLFAGTVIVLTASLVTADEIGEGLWQGVMVPPEGHEVGVGFKVSSVAGRTLMTMSVPGMGVVSLSKPTLEDGVMTFSFEMGETRISCELDATPEGGYEGPCTDEDGKESSITMTPVE